MQQTYNKIFDEYLRFGNYSRKEIQIPLKIKRDYTDLNSYSDNFRWVQIQILHYPNQFDHFLALVRFISLKSQQGLKNVKIQNFTVRNSSLPEKTLNFWVVKGSEVVLQASTRYPPFDPIGLNSPASKISVYISLKPKQITISTNA